MNKRDVQPATLKDDHLYWHLTPQERITILANLILDILDAETQVAAKEVAGHE